jgi:hypothetical protein
MDGAGIIPWLPGGPPPDTAGTVPVQRTVKRAGTRRQPEERVRRRDGGMAGWDNAHPRHGWTGGLIDRPDIERSTLKRDLHFWKYCVY